jgi:nitrous oxide reductase accessory protein NosL
MGAYLSAFSKVDDAKSTVAENGGEVYNWKELKAHILKK